MIGALRALVLRTSKFAALSAATAGVALALTAAPAAATTTVPVQVTLAIGPNENGLHRIDYTVQVFVSSSRASRLLADGVVARWRLTSDEGEIRSIPSGGLWTINGSGLFARTTRFLPSSSLDEDPTCGDTDELFAHGLVFDHTGTVIGQNNSRFVTRNFGC